MDNEYAGIPEITLGALTRYVEQGIPPGSFLTAVLKNDLFDAMSRADMNNRYALHTICMYIYNKIPSTAWGNEERVSAWIESGGTKKD